MNILVICQYYAPEPFRISDICEEFVKHGHKVCVITGIPNYPMGKIYKGYEKGEKKKENINGVEVRHCFTIARKAGVLNRFLNYYSFAISSTICATRLKEKFDVVFVNQLSPVMMAYAGIKYAKKHGVKLVLYCLDLWPESLIAGGISRKSPVFKLFTRISRNIYTSADHILVSSNSFLEYFEKQMQISGERISYLPQYAETIFSAESCRKQNSETIDLMFAGNIGAMQSVDTIIKAANETKDISNLVWHIVGDGSELENVRSLAKALHTDQVIFHGRQLIEEMPKFYAMADAMIVTMKDDPLIALTLPGKVQSYMAAGKPIIGAINGEAAQVINEADCGICVPAEDYLGLAEAVRAFCDTQGCERWGANAVRAYEERFSKTKVMDELERVLKCESFVD